MNEPSKKFDLKLNLNRPKLNSNIVWFGVFWICITLVNLLISYTIKNMGLSHVVNPSPFGLNLGVYPILFIFLFVAYFVFYLNFYQIYTIPSLLILAGMLSNLTELFLFGGATDYISIFIAIINLADVQIWLGLLWLNYKIWLSESG
jgi:lipoprotein signal peptidase